MKTTPAGCGSADQAFLPHYAGRFFAQFSRRYERACWVLDDLHEAQDSPELLLILQVLLDRLPDGWRLFCLSRAALPRALRDYWERRLYSTLANADLRLTDDEACRIAAALGRTDPPARIAAANRRQDGWVKGFVDFVKASGLDSEALSLSLSLSRNTSQLGGLE